MRKIFYIFVLFAMVARAEDTLVDSYFSEIEKWQQQSQKKYADFGDLLIFVSFSMPKESLRQLIADAYRVGGRLVIRGLVNNSFKDTARALYALLGEDQHGGVMVDPTLFKKFNITRVPGFVVVNHGNLSQPLCPKYDVVYGDVSLVYVLRKIVSAGEERDVAQRMLNNFKSYTAL